ncbi:MAG: hypothetical protein KatS3mg110_3243 [Pirellulaceae bacterium]|nr:MAG: hypothetical protein KatS3mg110_3243 [Pirellulaceae bacterium]
MMIGYRWLGLLVSIGFWVSAAGLPAQESDDALWPMPERLVPPVGVELDPTVGRELLERCRELEQRLEAVRQPERADAAVLVKAVRLAVENREFYTLPRDLEKARRLLDLAQMRVGQLEQGRAPWTAEHGPLVLGFLSRIDGSPQPYGLVVPDDWDGLSPLPLYVWLHGRGDRVTDLHFIEQRLRDAGPMVPKNALIVHPFGRQCVAFKFAGETDVWEAIHDVMRRYPVDERRVVLAGFSMGGAGAWHLGAHYAWRWAAVSPGAGFAETARYVGLTPDKFPPEYEQKLWHLYDAPSYVRNLFAIPVIAYSGELDRQIQAARVMEEAYREHGRELVHLVGPQTGHQYERSTLARLMQLLEQAVKAGSPQTPREVTLQTRTLRYNRQYWVELLRLKEHWQDTRVDARMEEGGVLEVHTTNVAAFRLLIPPAQIQKLTVDGDEIVSDRSGRKEINGANRITLVHDGKWKLVPNELEDGLWKKPGLQGPIDDLFFEPFLVVVPSGRCWHPNVDRWVRSELQHFRRRWKTLMRGELRIKKDAEVTREDMANYHLVLWGDPQSNKIMGRFWLNGSKESRLPLRWDRDQIRVGDRSFDAAGHVPVFIYPNPDAPNRYVVINSGLTFREEHDRTNAQQTPKLPDWAILDISEAPDGARAGRVVAADFFDERWQLKAQTAK